VKSNARYRTLLDFLIGLLRDDEAYIGWLYQYLVVSLEAPRFTMLSGLTVQRILEVAGVQLSQAYPAKMKTLLSTMV
jgi:hypothetical protein